MFGILYSIYSALGIGIYKAKEGYRAEGRKQNAINNNCDTYTDAKGRTRYIVNNRWVCYTKVNGHTVLKDCLNDKVYIDYTKNNETKRQNYEKDKAIKDGKTVYLFMKKEDVNKNDPWKGDRYKDIKTGSVYVKRYDNINVYSKHKCKFYVDVSTGMYVRKADEQIELDKKMIKEHLGTKRIISDDNIDEYINKMNDKQRKYKERGDDLFYYGGGVCL